MLAFTIASGWDARRGAGKNGASVLVRLSVDLEDGSTVTVVSDTAWKSAQVGYREKEGKSRILEGSAAGHVKSGTHTSQIGIFSSM